MQVVWLLEDELSVDSKHLFITFTLLSILCCSSKCLSLHPFLISFLLCFHLFIYKLSISPHSLTSFTSPFLAISCLSALVLFHLQSSFFSILIGYSFTRFSPLLFPFHPVLFLSPHSSLQTSLASYIYSVPLTFPLLSPQFPLLPPQLDRVK